MFIIPTKANKQHNYAVQLVDDIRRFNQEELIVVVDSDSEDKSYHKELEKYTNVIVEDVKHKNYALGSYWYCYKKYPKEKFYHCLHDTMRIKSNIDFLKEKELSVLFNFDRVAGMANNIAYCEFQCKKTRFSYHPNGKGVYGPIFFCSSVVMEKLQNEGFMEIYPTTKHEASCTEWLMGFAFESLGYDLNKCCLMGDILHEESSGGRSGLFPHKTEWQYPIEKFYARRL